MTGTGTGARTIVRLLSGLLLFFVLSGVAHAQVVTLQQPKPFPDPKNFARGFFMSGEVGGLFFLGKTGDVAPGGPAFGVRTGYEFVRAFALQARALASTMAADTPPPIHGQSFQTYLFVGEAEAALPLRRFKLALHGGAGAMMLSSNILDTVGIGQLHRTSLAVTGGLGFDYHTLNRHFSLGFTVDYVWLDGFSGSSAIIASSNLRYTF